MEKFIVSARKYRPGNFAALVGQESIAQTLKNSIKRGQLAHAYLFCGPRGVGKTSTARIFAKTINCLNPGPDLEPCGECESCRSFAEGVSFCIHELDAASNNSVEDIRTLIDQVRIPPQTGRYSVYIIDEVHMLSAAAFNAFLKTLEEPPAYAIFILATTEKHKIIPTVLSRCQTYDFNRISIADIVKQLKGIASSEGITVEDEALHVIAQKADGAMRDALTLFDQAVAFCGTNITYLEVIRNLNVLDTDYYFNLVESFLAGNYANALKLFDEVLAKGFNALYFVGGLSRHIRDLMVCKDNISLSLLETSELLAKRYKEQSSRCSLRFLYNILGESIKCEQEYRTSSNQRLLVEFLLVKACAANSAALREAPAAQQAQATQAPAAAQAQAAAQPSAAAQLAAPATQQQTAAPQQTAAAPQQAAAPQASGSFSIKNLIKNATLSHREGAEKAKEQQPVTQEELLRVWLALAEEQKPNLRSAMIQSPATLQEDGTTILFMVSNGSQKDWIMAKMHTYLSDTLRERLHNSQITLDVDVRKLEELPKTPYMPEERAKHIIQNNPEARELVKDLDLEIK
ncbi:MAG: DNA polymerase III subunit gamma/tau [Candidatus Egerieousia sp.]|nr:DNA polymerase III subunit gamma/tau [Candidatus Egerieousia sp.]